MSPQSASPSTDGLVMRTERLLGAQVVAQLRETRVLLFGVGGVGSWCAESLVRSGVGHLTLVDSDVVAPSNLNRQLMATTATIGQPKVSALRERLLQINPAADIVARQEVYSPATADRFELDMFDYVVDAIDSLDNKAALIRHATSLSPRFFSSMGAALKLDPTRIHVAEFWQVKGCPLARALRNKFRRQKLFPHRKFQCVYSDELLANQGGEPAADDAWATTKAIANGSLVHITAIFGFTLAGLILQDITRSCPS